MAMIGVGDYRARRNANHQVLGAATVTIRATSVFAATGSPSFAMCQGCQAVDSRLGHHDDAAAVASVAAVGPAARHVLLTAEAHATVPAAAGLDFDGDAINEH